MVIAGLKEEQDLLLSYPRDHTQRPYPETKGKKVYNTYPKSRAQSLSQRPYPEIKGEKLYNTYPKSRAQLSHVKSSSAKPRVFPKIGKKIGVKRWEFHRLSRTRALARKPRISVDNDAFPNARWKDHKLNRAEAKMTSGKEFDSTAVLKHLVELLKTRRGKCRKSHTTHACVYRTHSE